MTAAVFSDTICELGEGPLWHPERGELIWFDILGRRMFARAPGGPERHWDFDEHVSAAGWVSEGALLIASETALWRFDIETGTRERVVPLEADNPVTRSNDGRADPWGGFWIGTMGKRAEPRAGAIWRYWRGELRRLVPDVTISNSICFAPDGSCAYWTDTADGRIWRQPLQPDTGWPRGEPELFADFRGRDFGPDGSVTDSAGNLWNAQWGAGRVVCLGPDGRPVTTLAVPGAQASCPAFGGPDLRTLFVTTAAQGLTDPASGRTYALPAPVAGLPEHRVIL